jgi:hypothetical protein
MILMMWDTDLVAIRTVADQLCGFRVQTSEVASPNNKPLDAHAILGTSTKPDWVSGRFLSEKFGISHEAQ